MAGADCKLKGARLCAKRQPQHAGMGKTAGISDAPCATNALRLVLRTQSRSGNASPRSIPSEPQEWLRSGEGISVRTPRTGKVGERSGDGRRGLQIGRSAAVREAPAAARRNGEDGWNFRRALRHQRAATGPADTVAVRERFAKVNPL